MDGIVNRLSGRIDKQIRIATVGVFSQILTKTPVDTGRAKGNWIPSVGSPVETERDLDDKSGAAGLAEIKTTVPEKAGKVVYLSNNLPYIRRLEEGWSPQASPGAMVRLSVNDFPKMLAAAFRVGDL